MPCTQKCRVHDDGQQQAETTDAPILSAGRSEPGQHTKASCGRLTIHGERSTQFVGKVGDGTRRRSTLANGGRGPRQGMLLIGDCGQPWKRLKAEIGCSGLHMQFGSLARIGTSLRVHWARNLRNCYSTRRAGSGGSSGQQCRERRHHLRAIARRVRGRGYRHGLSRRLQCSRRENKALPPGPHRQAIARATLYAMQRGRGRLCHCAAAI
jgi:hypothetical protein